MSMCAGKTYCKIYRDKKYCKKKAEENLYGECNCRHAVRKCETECGCSMHSICPIKKEENKCIEG